MNNNSNGQRDNKSGYKIKRDNMTAAEARRNTVRKPHKTADGNSAENPNKKTADRSRLQGSDPYGGRSGASSRPQSRGGTGSARAAGTDRTASAPYKVNDQQKAGGNAASAEAYATHDRSSAHKSPSASSQTAVSDRPVIAPKQRGRGDSKGLIKPTYVVRVRGGYDKIMLVLVIILTLFGIIMDFSASFAYASSSYDDSFHFVKKQILYAGIGFIGMIVAMKFDYKWLRKFTVPAFIAVMILLFYVLVKGMASGEAQRWIGIGSFTIQPSELMKFTLVLMLALYVARNQDRIANHKNKKQANIFGVFLPLLIVGIVCIVVALEKHFSGTIIIGLIGLVIIFTSGARLFWLFVLGGSGIAAILSVALLVPYARERISMFLHPENYQITGGIWQTMQGLYAVGSGGLFGVGLGNSKQKYLYVSQPQNDFVFSIIAEELGFVGAILVIVLFMLLIWRGFSIALKAPDTFSSLVVIGIISKVAIQSVLNIAVVTNLIPNTGISLPFFSYGGTALVMQLVEMGIVLSISRFSYLTNSD